MAQGFLQIYGIDFNKTFSSIIRKKLLQIFLAIFYILSLILNQVNIIMAYFKSLLIDNDLLIFMKLLSRIELFKFIKAGLMVCLPQNIYGLRQSGKLWNQKVITFFTNLGFGAINADLSILIWQKKKFGITMISI